MFDSFISKWKVEARANSGEGWRICQDKIIEIHILPFLSGKKMSEITPSDISNIINASIEKNHSPNTTKKIYMVLSKIFNDAVEFFEVINKSPVKKRFHKPKTILKKQPALNLLQAIALLEYVMHNPVYGPPIWIQTLAGLRTSEIEALEWPDIRFDMDTITIQRSYNKHTKKIQQFTKNKTHYSVPIPPMLKKFLLSIRKTNGFVCPNKDGGMFNRDGYKCYFRKICHKLNLPIKSPHGLRHSCAKIYKMLGATNEEIQKLLGHKTSESTKTYLHDELELQRLKNLSLKIS